MIKKSILAISLGVIATQALEAKNSDPFLWLEEVQGKKALEWVEKQNKHSTSYLQSKPLFKELAKKNLAVYDSDENIPYVSQMGDHLYNVWKDSEHKVGLWRRTSLAEYKKEEPKWETVLDFDALAKAEDENWVYKGSTCLYPTYDRCLLRLSRGGADAVVVREFDMKTKTFVKDGFELPESKTNISWVDKNTLLVGTNFTPEKDIKASMTDSGYARIIKRWKRGTPLAKAELIFEGNQADVGSFAGVTHDGDKSYQIIYQAKTFYTSDLFLVTDKSITKLNLPEDASITSVLNGQMIIELKSDWKIDDKTYLQASLLSIDTEKFLAGSTDFTEILVPDDKTAIASVSTTKDYLLINTLKDVSSELYRYAFSDGKWTSEKVKMPDFGTISIADSSDNSNDFFINYSNFLTPTSLYLFEDKDKKISTLKSLPAYFDASPYKVEQNFVTAKDGTKVPYFMIMRKDTVLDGTNPTLQYAYGGFEVSQRPYYSATLGINWLEQGGVYVLANIRGGGEYGPDWHQAALKENRHVAFNDFISISEDLIKRKVTSPAHLGIRGGSNGGLLVGVIATMRPDLYNAVVCQVPLLDMKRFNKLLAGASWMGEYGNPDNEDEWNYIRSYSPYHNVHADVKYPKIFFTTSTRDDRVHPAHARKMVAKMKSQGHDLLYYENTEGGHGGAANNQQSADLQAMIYTYLQDQLH